MNKKEVIALTSKDVKKQLRKETIASLALYLGFFIWWYLTGYGVAQMCDINYMPRFLGLPLWFTLSCIVGYILFIVASALLISAVFKNFSLDEAADVLFEDVESR